MGHNLLPYFPAPEPSSLSYVSGIISSSGTKLPDPIWHTKSFWLKNRHHYKQTFLLKGLLAVYSRFPEGLELFAGMLKSLTLYLKREASSVLDEDVLYVYPIISFKIISKCTLLFNLVSFQVY